MAKIKVRKISNCKSKRLEPKIMELINKNIEVSLVAKKLNISHCMVKAVAMANGVVVDGRTLKIREKKERNERIHKMLLQDKKYDEIAEKMKITKQRVYQIALTYYNYSRQEELGKGYEIVVNNIKNDIKTGLSYKHIKNKYKLNSYYVRRLEYWGLPKAIYKEYQNKRNKNIGAKYKSGKKAIEIISSNEKSINDPQGVKTLSQVYAICTKQGIYKYPKVGRRIDGVCFEDVSVLCLIKKLREVKQFSFEEIAKHLNLKKYKTVCGKSFNSANVWFKYKYVLRENL